MAGKGGGVFFADSEKGKIMLGDSCHYSETEMRLFEHFGMANIACHMQPPMLYALLATKAFILNDQTPWADGLRRCLIALEKCSTYRKTPEWDALILGDEKCQVSVGVDAVCGLPSNSQIHTNYTNPQRHDFRR
jgi:hypothetical protein